MLCYQFLLQPLTTTTAYIKIYICVCGVVVFVPLLGSQILLVCLDSVKKIIISVALLEMSGLHLASIE